MSDPDWTCFVCCKTFPRYNLIILPNWLYWYPSLCGCYMFNVCVCMCDISLAETYSLGWFKEDKCFILGVGGHVSLHCQHAAVVTRGAKWLRVLCVPGKSWGCRTQSQTLHFQHRGADLWEASWWERSFCWFVFLRSVFVTWTWRWFNACSVVDAALTHQTQIQSAPTENSSEFWRIGKSGIHTVLHILK